MGNTQNIERNKRIYHVTIVGCVVNIFLAIIKMIAGVIGRSGAMVADAVHSTSDLASDIVVLLFVKIASKPKDADHNYGYGKYETLATTIIGLALAAVGIGIMSDSIKRVIDVVNGATLDQPHLIALIVAFISIVAKEILYWYTKNVGEFVKSSAVIANAWHHRSDALSSIGTFIGIGCAYFLGEKWRIADPIAAIIVSILILKVAYELTKVGIDELLERSLSKEEECKILGIISQNPKVTLPHNLRTRSIGNNIAVEVHIRVDGSMSVEESHRLTIEIESNLRQEYGQGCIVGIHVEPIKRTHTKD